MKHGVPENQMAERTPISEHGDVRYLEKDGSGHVARAIALVSEQGEQRTVKEKPGNGHDSAKSFAIGLEGQERAESEAREHQRPERGTACHARVCVTQVESGEARNGRGWCIGCEMIEKLHGRRSGGFWRVVATLEARSHRMEVLCVHVDPIEAPITSQDGIVASPRKEVDGADKRRKADQRPAVSDGSVREEGPIPQERPGPRRHHSQPESCDPNEWKS